MPIFEFECSQCQSNFEELVRNSEAATKIECPTCGGKKVKKKLSTFAAKVNGGSTALSAASAAACAPGGT